MTSPLYKQHPLSAAYPSMEDSELDALAADIEEHGQHEPIVIFEGMVLDGWHRYQGCMRRGMLCEEELLPREVDPAAFVESRNGHRRHLTASQRAIAALRINEWRQGAGRPSNCAPGAQLNPAPASAEDMAKAQRVSVRTIVQAKAAERAGLGDAVRDGAVSVKQAVELAKVALPPTAQQLKQRRQREADAAAEAEKLELGREAFGDKTVLEDLQEAHKENDALLARIEALSADDQKAETLKWRMAAQTAQRRQDELMTVVNERDRQLNFYSRTIKRICKAVGEEDPTKIAAVIEAHFRKPATPDVPRSNGRAQPKH